MAEKPSFLSVGKELPTSVTPVVPAEPVVVPSPGFRVKCILNESKPMHTVVENHACMRQVHTAVFLSSPDEKNSHPFGKVDIHSLEALPYSRGGEYYLTLRPVTK